MCRRFGLVAVVVLAAGTAASAQQFVNRDFSSGDLTGWTIDLTPNGANAGAVVEVIDIDGIGPLEPSNALRVQVGKAVSAGDPGGVDIYQTLHLEAGVEYAISFNFATTANMPQASNADGGSFSVLIDQALHGTQATGSTAAGCFRYGYAEAFFTPPATGLYQVGARVTRSFLVSGVQGYLDNFDLRPAVRGACCMPEGQCMELTESNCTAQSGAYQGDQVSCMVACGGAQPPSGACCLNDGSCQEIAEIFCHSTATVSGMGFGYFVGDWTECATSTCPMRLHTAFTDYFPNSQVTQRNAGIFFDLTASGNETLSIRRFDYYSNAEVGNWTWVQVWTYPGSYVGRDSDPTGWVLHERIPVRSPGSSARQLLDLAEPIVLEAGQTTGIYLIAEGGGIRIRGTSASPPTQTTFMDGNLTVFTDLARTAPWGGTAEFPRAWSGTVHYTFGGGPPGCYADCDGNDVLNIDDFLCFINEFAQAQALPPSQQVGHYANCDGSTFEPILTIDDFICFINEFSAGCS